MLRTLPEEVEYLSLADYGEVLAGPRAADVEQAIEQLRVAGAQFDPAWSECAYPA
jgi:hypothetical protein